MISSHPIPALEAKVAAMKLMEHGVYFEVYSNKGAFTNDKEKSLAVLVDIFMSANPDIDINEVLKSAEARFEHGLVQVVDDYEKLFSNEETKIYKFLAFSLELEKLALVRDALENMETIVVSSSGHENLEITSTDAQKGIALEAFSASKDISLAETMAIGDNFNDLSMFKRAGKSVAMGNASDVIKAQCDLTTASNAEDGVAQAIYEAIKASV